MHNFMMITLVVLIAVIRLFPCQHL